MALNAIDLSRPLVPTATEKQLVKHYVLLPVLLTMLQQDIDAIRDSAVRISFPHIVVIQRMMDSVREDLSRIRANLGLAGIRIYSEERDSEGISCRYVCRGYRETFRMPREDVKTEISLLAGRYVEARSSSHGS
ncbi:hypothetical protein [Gorillibacterium timonense]|uniref:hypothetical protein n=1 Tax=Gorillibacterium timonense TaxID=1689269 RepID=UPI00071CC29E|nr:hypothetical protein [Gorillibacterium timonense]